MTDEANKLGETYWQVEGFVKTKSATGYWEPIRGRNGKFRLDDYGVACAALAATKTWRRSTRLVKCEVVGLKDER